MALAASLLLSHRLVTAIGHRDTPMQAHVTRLCSKEERGTKDGVAALKKEIDILQQVGQHENITSIFDVYLTKTELHIVMELCEGGELFDRLVSNGPYSEESARQHMYCICDALKFLHKSKIIHRDLKPENIMLKTKDPESALRIADFGLGKIIDEKVR